MVDVYQNSKEIGKSQEIKIIKIKQVLVMDGKIDTFPQAFTEYACPRRNQFNFHAKTREACKTGTASNVSLKVAKSIVIGDMSVGKTSLINRYCHNVFEKDYKPTIGVEYELKKYQVLNHEFHLQMWDTSGEERFKAITGAYYRGANVVMVVFDLTSASSLSNASTWLYDALEKTRTTTPEIFLVGNKRDLTKENDLKTTRETAIDIANEMNAEYWEVSAKTGENVKEFFTRVTALCFDQSVLREIDTRDEKSSKMQMGNGSIITTNKSSETIVLCDKTSSGGTISEAYDNKRKGCCK